MSIKILNLVWKQAHYSDTYSALVMLALADWADDQGRAWPSIEKLAKKSRQSVRKVQYILRQMERDGYLTITPSNGRTPTYRIALDKLASLEPAYDEGKPAGPPTASDNERSGNRGAHNAPGARIAPFPAPVPAPPMGALYAPQDARSAPDAPLSDADRDGAQYAPRGARPDIRDAYSAPLGARSAPKPSCTHEKEPSVEPPSIDLRSAQLPNNGRSDSTSANVAPKKGGSERVIDFTMGDDPPGEDLDGDPSRDSGGLPEGHSTGNPVLDWLIRNASDAIPMPQNFIQMLEANRYRDVATPPSPMIYQQWMLAAFEELGPPDVEFLDDWSRRLHTALKNSRTCGRYMSPIEKRKPKAAAEKTPKPKRLIL